MQGRTSIPLRLARRFGPEIRQERWLILGACAAALGEVAVRVLEPWPLKLVFDRLLPPSDTATPVLIAACAGAIIALAALRATAAYLATVGFALAGNRVVTAARGRIFAHLQRLSLSFHHRSRVGDLVTRLLGDVGRLQEVTVTAALPLAVHGVTLVIMLAVMACMNLQLALVALGALPVFLLVSRRLGGRIRVAARQQRKREGQMGATAAEAIGSIRVVQSLALEGRNDASFARRNASSLREGVRTRRLAARLERSVDVVIAVATAAVLWLGVEAVQTGTATAGDLVVFLAYLKTAFKPLRDLAKYTGRLAKASASAERILDVLDAEPEVRERADAVDPPVAIACLRFDGVSFAYAPGAPALTDVSFEAHRGELVALVGPSGAGKSTLLSLLLRLYDPTEGRILMDEADLRGLRLRGLRERIAVVPQENVLFGTTVRENIAYGAPDASPARIEAAARIARAHDFIERLPDGYDTILAERGDTLSGGQRQRVALARAVVRDAPILVLDEPTASLDPTSADGIRAALRDLRRDRITIIVAHDPTTVAEADRVVRLEGGRVAFLGAPAAHAAHAGRRLLAPTLPEEVDHARA